MLKTLKQVRCLDLQSQVKLSEAFCQKWEKDHLFFYVDGHSNRERLHQDFVTDLSNLYRTQLGIICEELRANHPQCKLFADLLLLLQGEVSNEEIRKVLSALRDAMDPRKLDHSVKQKLIAQATGFIQQLPAKSYFSVLGMSFPLDVSHLLIDDELFCPLFEGLQKMHPNMKALDLSNTFISGRSLRGGIGLPIQTMNLYDLPHLDGQALSHLVSYPELRSLNLSGSPVDPPGLLRSIRILPLLEELVLNRCDQVTGPAVEACVYGLMDTLEFLSLEQTTIHSNVVERMVGRGSENISKPFLVL